MTIAVQEAPAGISERPMIVNDFTLNIATVNGSGSQTSNGVLLRALFKMGIPVTGKNLFPSNIQGLPTWYVIRLSKDGYLARRDGYEIVVCMNGAQLRRRHGRRGRRAASCSTMTRCPFAARRDDVTYYADAGQPAGQGSQPAVRPEGLHRQHGLRRACWPTCSDIDLAEIEAAVELELRRQGQADRAEHGHGRSGPSTGPRRTWPSRTPSVSSA